MDGGGGVIDKEEERRRKVNASCNESKGRKDGWMQ
jgi:hypothetical protein